METIADNIGGTFASISLALTPSLNYYADPDGVVRPGAGAYNNNPLNSPAGTPYDAGRPMAMTAPGGSHAEWHHRQSDTFQSTNHLEPAVPVGG